jgi:glutamine cyclotransferase
MYPELKGAQNENVLNGIAWDSTGNRFFITGKKWSKLFEIKIQ